MHFVHNKLQSNFVINNRRHKKQLNFSQVHLDRGRRQGQNILASHLLKLKIGSDPCHQDTTTLPSILETLGRWPCGFILGARVHP